MIVVSDLSGTLTTGSPVLGLVDWVRHHQSRLRADIYMASVIPSYFLAKWGVIDIQKFASRLMVNCLPLVKDATSQKVQEMAEWSVDTQLWPKRRQDVLARLARHKENGAQVFIASSIIEPTVQVFARRIGAGVIATPIEIKNGRLTVPNGLAAEKEKIRLVLDRLGVERVDMAYGDTWQDIPLLENAKKAVAVYPDRGLRSAAIEHGWEILEDTKDKG